MGKKKIEAKEASVEKEEEPKLFFENVLDAVLTRIAQKVLVLRLRPGGAQEYGSDAMFVCATENLATARQAKDANQYMLAAAYVVVAALQLMGQWEIDMMPPQKSEVGSLPEPKKEEKKDAETKKE